MSEHDTPSGRGFALMIILTVQGIVWFAIGLAAGYALWHS